jgi:hypothetical protein
MALFIHRAPIELVSTLLATNALSVSLRVNIDILEARRVLDRGRYRGDSLYSSLWALKFHTTQGGSSWSTNSRW